MLFIHKTEEKQIEVNILDDDSIEMAKYKLSIRLNCSANDIYLFAKQNKLLNTRKIYDELLSKKEKTELEKGDLENLFYNLNKKPPDLPDKAYTYDDLLSLLDLNGEMDINIPVGHVVRVCANPLDCTADLDFDLNHYLVTYKKMNTLNQTLILDYMPFVDNTIYVVCKKEVRIPEPYFVDIDTSLATLQRKAEVMNLYKDRLPSKSSLIYNMEFTILPFSKVSLPLESLFNLLHASPLYPMIQYNTGSTIIYKLHTVSHDVNNNKIPTLPKSAIVNQEEIQNLYKVKSVNVYIESRKKIIMFKENGSIHVSLLDIQVPETEVDALIQSILNPILDILKEPLHQAGYVYSWRSIWSDSSEIKLNSLMYIIDFDQQVYHEANFNNISNLCIRIKDNQCIYLRISNFDKNKLSYQIMTHLRVLGATKSVVIKSLTTIFDMDQRAADELYSDFINKDVKLEGKPQLKIKSGFEVMVNATRIIVNAIDSMHYLACNKQNIEAIAYTLVHTKKNEFIYIPEQFEQPEQPEQLHELEEDLVATPAPMFDPKPAPMFDPTPAPTPGIEEDDFFEGFGGAKHGIDAHKLKNSNFAITRLKNRSEIHKDYSSKCVYDKVPIVIDQDEWESDKYAVYREHVSKNELLKKDYNKQVLVCPKYWSFKKEKAYLNKEDIEDDGKIINMDEIHEKKITEIEIDKHGEYLPYHNFFNKKDNKYQYPDFVKGNETMPCCFILPESEASTYHQKKKINLVNEDYISKEDRPIQNTSHSLKYAYVSEPLRIFFKLDEKCSFINSETLSLLRLGPFKSNFLYTMYTIHVLPLPPTNKFTYENYLDSLLVHFETAQNGNLAVKYKSKEECRQHMNEMTHEDAWDLVSNNANIVIFTNSKSPTFELVCPTNVYRTPKFNTGSVTYMLYMHSGEPSYEIIVKKDKLKTDRAFMYNDPLTKEALHFIESKYNNECKPTIHYKIKDYTPTANLTSEIMYDLLVEHSKEQDSIGQVVQKNKCIGFALNEFFIPCYPSSKLDIDIVDMPISELSKTFKFLTKMARYIPCTPMYKVIGLDQQITGLLTETNHYVPCTPSSTKLKLEPYYANLQYEYDVVDDSVDTHRVDITNRIKYEQYGYKYCLNRLMIKLNTNEYYAFRKQIKDILKSTKKYSDRLSQLIQIIKVVLGKDIEWVDQIPNVYINHVMDHCPNGFCETPMRLSTINLITQMPNQYYLRLADELLRNKKITSFVLKPQLQFYVPYEARENELILDKFVLIKYMDELGESTKTRRYYDNAVVKQIDKKYTTFKVEKLEKIFIRP
jgi:hypothetical protein